MCSYVIIYVCIHTRICMSALACMNVCMLLLCNMCALDWMVL